MNHNRLIYTVVQCLLFIFSLKYIVKYITNMETFYRQSELQSKFKNFSKMNPFFFLWV